jgi:hypothetical protein
MDKNISYKRNCLCLEGHTPNNTMATGMALERSQFKAMMT